MSTESENANSDAPPLPLERREPENVVAPANTDSIEESDEDLIPISVSDEITVYSAKSDIRSPLLLFVEIWKDMLRGRELAWRLFLRNIRGMYRQTLLGLFWAFLPPIANTAIWIFLRKAGVFATDEIAVNATVYILTGMILWQSFIDAFQMPLQMLSKNRNLISKLNFPRESLLMVGLGEVLFNLGIRMLLLFPACLIFQVAIPISILYAPIVILALVLFATGLGLLIMPFGSLYQDVGRFIGMALPFWMIITPIIYPPLETMPGSLLNWLNPASPLLILGRDLLLIGSSDHLFMGLIYAGVTIPVLLMGLLFYRISIPVLVERMSA